MSEIIRIDIVDDELRAIMELMDDALRMKEALLTGARIEPIKPVTVVSPPLEPTMAPEALNLEAAASDIERILLEAGGLDAILSAAERDIEQILLDAGGLDAILFDIERARVGLGEVQTTSDEVGESLSFVFTEMTRMQNAVQLTTEEARSALLFVEAEMLRVQAETMRVQTEIVVTADEARTSLLILEEELKDLRLPSVNRATRMLLLRIPGLREVLTLMYQIKMLQGQLLTPGIASKVVALLVSMLYLTQAMEKRQRTVEARLTQLERDMNQRDITMEDAVRRFGELPERYRSTIVP